MWGELLIVLFIIIVALSVNWCQNQCYKCCNERNEVVYSVPVVVTSETHQAPNGTFTAPIQVYTSAQASPRQVNPQVHETSKALPYPTRNEYMPMPSQPSFSGTAPPHQGIAPYPSANAPAFNASDPMMAPPTYDDAVPKDFVNKFAKQEPYNPDFK